MEASTETRTRHDARRRLRARLLAGLPVEDRRGELTGLETAWLVGGEGPPLLLLHGPGESAVNWRWVLPELVRENRVVVPDLPAHGSTAGGGEEWGEARILAWLDALIESVCDGRPVLVGHVLGGALGLRFARERGDRLRALVLVDSLGLGPFRPSLRFLAGLIGFQAHPTETTYRWFMGQCAHDLDALRRRMGGDWEDFVAYNLELATGPGAKTVGRMLRELGLPRIPPEELDRIDVPTALVWGRHDRATKLEVAREASQRHGWPLQVVEEAADDPARDRPAAFLQALCAALSSIDPGDPDMSDAHYDTTFARKAAESYERNFVPAIGAPVAAGLVEAAELRPGERVLDVACGTGIVARLAADRVGVEGTVAGLDPNPAMLAVAREAASGVAPLAWHEAPAETMPFEDEGFDVALCGMGLQFFRDRVRGLREVHRVLVPGGRLVANVPGPTPPPLEAMADGLRRHVGPEAAGFVDAVFSLHQHDELRSLMAEAGFEDIEVDSEETPLELGPPETFLWSYVESTPLAAAAAKLTPEERASLERDYARACEPHLTDGMLKGAVRMTTVAAVK